MPRIKEADTTATSAKSKIAKIDTGKNQGSPKITIAALDELKSKVADNTYNIYENQRKVFLFEDRTSEAINKLIDNFNNLSLEQKNIQKAQDDLNMKLNVLFAIIGITFCGFFIYVLLNI